MWDRSVTYVPELENFLGKPPTITIWDFDDLSGSRGPLSVHRPPTYFPTESLPDHAN